MATYEIIQPDAASTAYNISNNTYCQLTYPNGISGIGLPTISRDLQRLANIDGGIDYGYKLEPREINLNLYYNVVSAAAADARRDAIYKIFRPFRDPLKLKVTRDDSTIRQIDVHTIGMVDLPMSERVGYDQAFSVRLLAPDPIWYNPTQVITTITPSASPWTFNVTYNGLWEEYPVIEVYGAVTGWLLQFTLSSASGTETFALPSVNVPAGDVFTFDLRPGYKTFKNAAGVSQLGSVFPSAVAAMNKVALWPDPIKVSGLNPIFGQYITKDANHKVKVYHYNRYGGL